MPIKPENKARYPADWKDIRARILERAGDRCELCFLLNGEAVHRSQSGRPLYFHEGSSLEGKAVKVVLTIAHINQQPEDNRDVNLLALCQRCHNRIDLPYRTQNAAATRTDKAERLRGRSLMQHVCEIIRQAGRPLHIDEMLARLRDADIELEGKNPRANFAAYVSRCPQLRRTGPSRYDIAN